MVSEADREWVGSMSEAYDRWLVPAVFEPFAIDLARRVAAHHPDRILEVAAGTGALTATLDGVAAAELVATDFNQAMVDVGCARAPNARWQQADAMNLPFDDAQFDVVVCQFGVMFFPDKRAAFTEIQRVLVPDGTFVFNTWSTLESHELQAAVVDVVAEILSGDPPPFLAAVPHGCADPSIVSADLAACGYAHVLAEVVTLEANAPSAAAIASGYCLGTPLRAEIESRADLDQVLAAVTELLQSRFGSGSVTGKMTANVFEASAHT